MNFRLAPQKIRAMAHQFRNRKNTIPANTLTVSRKVYPMAHARGRLRTIPGNFSWTSSVIPKPTDIRVTKPKTSLDKTLDAFEQELNGEQVRQLLPTMKLDLRKFLLPQLVHTHQCTRLTVKDVQAASVRVRDIVKDTVNICRTVPNAWVHLKPKQGGQGIACVESEFEMATLIGLARMIGTPGKSMGPRHALTKVTTAQIAEQVTELQLGGAKLDKESGILDFTVTETQSDKYCRYIEVGTGHHSSVRKFPIAFTLGLLAK